MYRMYSRGNGSSPRACAHRACRNGVGVGEPPRHLLSCETGALFGVGWRFGTTRCESTPRPGAHPEGTRDARYRRFYRSQHLDRSSGSLIRESRIFGQIGSFSAGMARRTPVGPVRHLCRWVSHGRRPREHAEEREHEERGRGRAAVVSRGKRAANASATYLNRRLIS